MKMKSHAEVPYNKKFAFRLHNITGGLCALVLGLFVSASCLHAQPANADDESTPGILEDSLRPQNVDFSAVDFSRLGSQLVPLVETKRAAGDVAKVRPDRRAAPDRITFRAAMALPAERKTLALQVPTDFHYADYWLDGELVASYRYVNAQAFDSDSRPRKMLLPLPAGASSVEFSADFSAADIADRGAPAVLLGEREQLLSSSLLDLLIPLLLAGLLFGVALYCAVTYIGRRKGSAHLFLSIVLVVLCIRTLVLSDLLFYVFPGMDAVWPFKLAQATSLLAAAAFVAFLVKVDSIELEENVQKAFLAIAVAVSSLLLLLPGSLYLTFKPYALYLSATWLLATGGLIVLGIVRKGMSASTSVALLAVAVGLVDIVLGFAGVETLVFEFLLAGTIAVTGMTILSVRLNKSYEEREHLAEELQKSNLSLQYRVEKRTRELAEKVEELESARKMAERANKNKTDFLAVMSHELRTPLSGIMGSLRHLAESETRLTEKQLLDNALNSCDALLEVINDILDMSKIEAGELKLHKQSFDLIALARSVRQLFAMPAQEKSIALDVSTAGLPDNGENLWVYGDEGRLRQVLSNLVNNALKFTTSGTIKIFVQLVAAQDDDYVIRINVIDTGIGIPQSRQEEIFNSFSQIDASSTRRTGGAGLGLPICKKLVEAMGGSIGVESVELKGSRFFVDLAMTRSEPRSSDAPPQEPEVRPAEVKKTERPLYVLVVEDDKANRELLVACLEKRGHLIRAEGNGLAGLKAVLSGGFDLVLMDVRMPIMDGVEATQKIREAGGSFKTLPIFAVTANIMTGEREKYIAAGFTGVLAKPVNRIQLDQLLVWAAKRSGEKPPIRKEVQREINRPANMLDTRTLDDLKATMDAKALALLLAKMQVSLQKNMAGLSDALTAERWQEAERLTHSMIGVCANYGMSAAASRLMLLHAKLSKSEEREACKQQRTEILGLLQASLKQLKKWAAETLQSRTVTH